ncbi:hypothetical protein [Paraburkholderia sp. MM5482-R1]|uniref:hypothetical protein n=1 Tax=unclassified Paraburkholderia TaxID=2615204 RepID=UPI003D198D7C
MSDKPFYADMGFYQWVIALAALALSQLPPVRLWFKRARLAVECFDKIVLDEEVGLPNTQWHLSVTNTGGREVRIQKITLTVTRGQDRVEMTARGYFEKLSDPRATLLTPFRLKAGEEWSHGVTLSLTATREARQTYSAAAKALKDDITAKRATLQTNHPDVEADQRVVQPLFALFDASFFWRAGEYEITLRIATNTPTADIARTFRFTLFESESDQLRAHREQLKFGNGVYFRMPPVDAHYAEVHPIV